MSRVAELTSDALCGFLQRQRWFGGKARAIAEARVVAEGPLDRRSVLTIVAVRFVDGGEERYFVPLMLSRDGLAVDALTDDRACRALVERIEPGAGRLKIRRTHADQSNTSIVIGDELILKVFRRVEPGLNPDVEISRFLTARGFSRVPALVADADYVIDAGAACSVLMLQRFVPNQGNAWNAMIHETAAMPPIALAERLGRRTGELHETLASDAGDSAFAPEPYSRAPLDALAGRIRAYGAKQLELLRSCALDGSVRTLARRVLDREDDLLARFDAIRDVPHPGSRIRCHGDYHLGQTLVADGDVFILDFEGEPARSLAERRTKGSPLRDVAGMLRSFDYAAKASGRGRAWERDVTDAFLDGYRAATRHADFLPSFDGSFETMLEAFVVEKALYELGYELNNRPNWVELPLDALARLEWRQSTTWPSSPSADPRIHSGSAPSRTE